MHALRLIVIMLSKTLMDKKNVNTATMVGVYYDPVVLKR